MISTIDERKITKSSIRTAWIPLSYFLLVSIAMIIFVYFQNGHLLIGDDWHFHENRIFALSQAMSQGNFFPKVDASFAGGFGYASSLFYPDLFLYIPAGLLLLGINYTQAYISYIILINLATLLIGYYSMRSLKWSTLKAGVFATLYACSIYRLQDLINRQSLGETLALTFLPLIFASIIHLKQHENNYWIGLSLGMTALLLSHLLSTELMGIFLVIYVLVNWRDFANKRSVKTLSKAFLLCLGLGAYYWIPLLEQIHSQTFQLSTAPLTSVSTNALQPGQLFSDSLLNAVFHSGEPNLGLLGLFGIVAANLALIFNRKYLKLTLIMDVFTIFTTTLIPWKLFDNTFLNSIQFPWRLLGIVTLLSTYLLVQLISEKNLRGKLVLTSLGIISIGSAMIYQGSAIKAQPYRLTAYADYNTPDSYYIGSGHEYLPTNLNYNNILNNKSRPVKVSSGNAMISNVQKGDLSAKFKVTLTSSKPATIVLPLTNYKGYTLSQHNATLEKVSTTGFVTLKVTKSGTYSVQYHNTAAQTMSALLSLGIVTWLGLYFLKPRFIDNLRLKRNVKLNSAK